MAHPAPGALARVGAKRGERNQKTKRDDLLPPEHPSVDRRRLIADAAKKNPRKKTLSSFLSFRDADFLGGFLYRREWPFFFWDLNEGKSWRKVDSFHKKVFLCREEVLAGNGWG